MVSIFSSGKHWILSNMVVDKNNSTNILI